MTDQALQPIEQKTVLFYEDEITAVVVDAHGRQQVYVPLRPICEYLGLSWSSQLQRVRGDAVLADEAMSVLLTNTDIDPTSRRPNTSEMICLPLRFLNGWLFGVNPKRVRPDLRERVIRYQRECYDALAQAFQSPAARPDASTTLLQVREMGLAIARMAEEQIEFDNRLTTTEGRLDQAAIVVADVRRRLTAVEQRLPESGLLSARAVTDDQASQLSQAVKTIALTLGKQTGRNEFAAVYGELYRRFGITSYKLLPAPRFDEAMTFLTDWAATL
jgi:hypothetical protein